jgi:hypothetical protein
MTRTPRVIGRVGLVSLGACLAACSGQDDRGDESVAEAAEAASTTCLNIGRGAPKIGGVDDAMLVWDPVDPTKAGTNYGATQQMNVGFVGTDVRQVLLRVDLSPLPPGQIITSAALTFRMIQSPGKANVELHRVLAPWTEGTVTYASFAAAFDPAIEASVATLGVPNNSNVTVDLTALVGDWYTGVQANHGVLFAHPAPGRTVVASAEAPTVAPRPSLTVCYAPDPCAAVSCAPPADCQLPGVCDPASGTCDYAQAPDGTACSAGVCQAGLCVAVGACPTGNCALRFDGVNDYVSVPDSPSLDSVGSFTVEAWMFYDQINSGCMTTVRKGTSSSPTYDYWLHKNIAPADSVFWASWTGFGVNGFGAVGGGAWHHLAGVYDKPGAGARVYVDGVLKGSGGAFATPTPNNDELRIGIDWDFGCPMDGVIDEVRISNVARYNAAFVPAKVFAVDASTVALWHFDEYAGGVVHDASGHGNDGVIQGASWTTEHP